jgi:glycosyltransferase involved in cell wall biosynthesis
MRTPTFPEISIILPTFVCDKNKERMGYLLEALESYNNQITNRTFEVILIDDGSSIDIESFVRQNLEISTLKFTFQYQKLRNRKEKSVARNIGLARARGKYITFADSDDRAMPNKLEELANSLDNNPNKDIVFGGIYLIDKDGQRMDDTPQKLYWQLYVDIPVRMGRTDLFTLDNLYKVNFIHSQSVMLRKEALGRTKGFSPLLTYGEDYKLWIDVLESSADKSPLALVEESGEIMRLAEYRIHKDNSKPESNLQENNSKADCLHNRFIR